MKRVDRYVTWDGVEHTTFHIASEYVRKQIRHTVEVFADELTHAFGTEDSRKEWFHNRTPELRRLIAMHDDLKTIEGEEE